MIKKSTAHINQNEGLIFERSRPGKTGYCLTALDVPAVKPEELLDPSLLRDDDLAGLPEVSEPEVVRHFTRLSTWNYAIDLGMYPLGSCTMKYNPKLNERVARIPGFAYAHPYLPDEFAQGNLALLWELEQNLAEITGMAAVSLQPAAGAQGEYTGLMVIRALLEARGDARKIVLVPDSAHGTNPASAHMIGYKVLTLKSNAEGAVDMDGLKKVLSEHGPDVAALMLTNPSTLGLFEENIEEICRLVHDAGGLVYMDGANMNALVGITRPGDMGVDVLHLNLHKTFSTPHGGGGPGAGPICVVKELEPFLPFPRVIRNADEIFRLEYNCPQSVGRVRAWFGNFSVLVRALCYIKTLGPTGLREATETAVLNANYIAHQLRDDYETAYPDGKPMHEVVLNDKKQAKFGVHTLDIAKRLIDYGFHPMTMYFPLIVHGAIMIEPTESEGREELDLFIDAMKSIAREAEENPELVKSAPHHTRIGRLDEATAARKPVLRWKPASNAAAGSSR
ncbi:MAG: aminomethyl-transferring glycine dehydrogenase subunit GcvPB [Acidobacteriota bacterium]